MTQKMKLGLSMANFGYHVGAWRYPGVMVDGNMRLQYYLDMTKTAERGLFDTVFLADFLALPSNDKPQGMFGRSGDMITLEPLTLLSALAPLTRNIGLTSTLSTTFMPPYHIARLFASLQHLSEGRAGWNVVTSFQWDEMRNFGIETVLETDERYERAREAVHVCVRLWESWKEGAFVGDKQSGIYFDRDKVHPIDHAGKYYKVRGPLNMLPPPSGRPLIFQAGASEAGRELAAETADVVYAAHKTLKGAQEYYKSVKSRTGKYGRREDDIKILPGILPVIGDTQEEAERKYEEMLNSVDPILGLGYLAGVFGDLSHLELDKPVPETLPHPPTMSFGQPLHRLALQEGWTLRQLYQRTAIGLAHNTVIGSPGKVADVMEEWFLEGGADGFNILPAVSPHSVTDFVDNVVPELQRRGIYRTAYEGTTLRENLGLA